MGCIGVAAACSDAAQRGPGGQAGSGSSGVDGAGAGTAGTSTAGASGSDADAGLDAELDGSAGDRDAETTSDAATSRMQDAMIDPGPTGYVPDPITKGENLPARVPVLRFDIDGQTIEKNVEISGTLEIFETHDGTLANLDTLTPTFSSPIGLQGRGNFTWTLLKKGYAFELQNGAGVDVKAEILGLPAGSDFALYACYTDKTCLRNALVYALGQDLAAGSARGWHPRARFVELILDGENRGLYMVWERIRRDAARVVLEKPAANASAGDLSGGYVFRVEGGKGTEMSGGVTYPRDFSVESGRKYTYHYPDADKITSEQAAYLQGFVQSFETAMAEDPSQYPNFIDVPSWVDRAILEELTNNWDGYVHSVYIIKQRDADGGKLVMGPLWDFDLAFANGNVTGYNCSTDKWAHEIVRDAPDDVAPYWLQLFADEDFRHAFKCRWQALRLGPLALSTFDARIAAWTTFFEEARLRDQAKWNTVGKNIFPNCAFAPTYAEEVSALRDWIEDRVTWIDAQVAGWPGACQ